MPLPPEVVRTIQALDKKIKAIEETKRRLIESFGGAVDTPVVSTAKTKAKTQAQETPVEPVPVVEPAPTNSKEILVAYLREHSPATRAEIVMGARVPNGSISWLIRHLSTVRRREDGKYELIREN